MNFEGKTALAHGGTVSSSRGRRAMQKKKDMGPIMETLEERPGMSSKNNL